jgi:hypothetical protein
MNGEEPISPAAFIGTTFRKRDTLKLEYIRFVSQSEFWHKFQGTEWTSHPYRIRQDGFELDWGSGDVFLCVFLRTSSQFLELNPRQNFYWELDPDFHEYSNGGSTSA